jgi:hypothetical protein
MSKVKPANYITGKFIVSSDISTGKVWINRYILEEAYDTFNYSSDAKIY